VGRVETPFERLTTLDRVADGRYRGSIDDRWNLRPLPQGGVVTAVAVAAMTASLDDDRQQLRTLHTTFAAQVAHGPVVVEVEVLRRGRSMSHLRAEVRNPDRDRGHLTTAVFGTDREGVAFVDLEPPAAPPPDDCPSWRDPPPPGVDLGSFQPMPFWEQMLEGRSVLGHPPWEEFEPGPAEVVDWFRFDEPPLRADGTLDPASLPVLADVMPGAVNERTARRGPTWFAPSVDLTLHVLGECRSPWVLAHNRVRHAGSGYASADMALWERGPDGAHDPTLVAYATQVFFFTFPGS
jgi:acyl-CoA thioesterase